MSVTACEGGLACVLTLALESLAPLLCGQPQAAGTSLLGGSVGWSPGCGGLYFCPSQGQWPS